MKKILLLLALVTGLNLAIPLSVASQETSQPTETPKNPAQINLGADLVSRYIWRGRDYGNSPSVQPNLSFSVAGFKIGAWGSYGLAQSSKEINDTTVINMGHYAEMDLYLSYTYKWFTLQITDYFFPNPLNANEGNRYFNYDNATTGHTLEGCLMFAGPEKFPLQLTFSTLFYGADKNKDSLGVYGAGTGNNYSTYIEAAYIFKLHKIGVDLKPFVAGIPFGSSWYGDYAGIVNCGLTATKVIGITEKFSLPLYVSLITNPQAESVFLVVGLTL